MRYNRLHVIIKVFINNNFFPVVAGKLPFIVLKSDFYKPSSPPTLSLILVGDYWFKG